MMYVKQFRLILLLSFIYGACADADLTADVNVKSGTQNVLEDVFYLSKTCASDADCSNSGRCEMGKGGKFCNCKNGTSGDFCEKVDECINNPLKCGTAGNVSCVFDVQKEKAACMCDNENKTYVEDEERCMSPCLKYSDCGENGYCEIKVGDQKFCACTLGTSGDFCEIIDQCHYKVVDCGVENNATCTLGGKGKAYCKCDDKTKGFDYDEKICKGCEGCGKNVYRLGGCDYRNGTRRCACQIRYYSSEKGICEDCKCGKDSYGCKFINGTKICQCWTGAANKNGYCNRCDCGSGLGVSKCEFIDDKKVCTCKEGYALAGPNGPCKLMCNATNPCANGGKCVQNVCKCLKGTSGDLCQTIDDCKGMGKCGYEPCLYNVTSKEAYCKCEGSRKFDDYYKKCKDCSCGSYTKGCKFVQGKKRCNCTAPYAERLGTCTLCLCKGLSSKDGCKFDDVGDMKCQCLKGYTQEGDECKKCDCGDHGKCHLDGTVTKYCTCDEGYAEYNGECKECDCGKKGRCQFNLVGQKTCICPSGYKEYEGICKACYCGWNAKCEFNEYGTAECKCDSGYGMKNGQCTQCNCYPGTSCTFDTSNRYSEKKTCDCPKGYADDNGKCRVCDCEINGSNCTYSLGYNRCQCPKGYKEEYKKYSVFNRICVEIDGCTSDRCPLSSTKCVSKLGNYECVCKDGYEPRSSFYIETLGCQDINECVVNYKPCDDSDAVCINTLGSYKCDCKYGYLLKASEEKRNVCQVGTFGNRPWRTASIIVGVASAVIIIGLIIAILDKYKC